MSESEFSAGCVLLLAFVAFGIAVAVIVGHVLGAAWGWALALVELGTALALTAGAIVRHERNNWR